MTDEEKDGWGEAIALAEQDQRDTTIALQAERESQDRARAARLHRCPVEGCAVGDCPACQRIRQLEREIAELTAESPLHVSGRYYAREADAATWRAIELEQRHRFADRIRAVHSRRLADRVAERVDVDEATYLEGLALLAGAWALREFPRFRDTLGYVANVEWPEAENEPEREQAGRRAWAAAAPRDFLGSTFEITEAGRAALAQAEDGNLAADAAVRNTARMFDAMAASCFPGFPSKEVA
jgi:hypothetical protein